MRTFSLLAITTLTLLPVFAKVTSANELTELVTSKSDASPSIINESRNPSAVRQYMLEGELTTIERTLLGGKTNKVIDFSRIVLTENRVAKLGSVRQSPYVTSVEIIKGPYAEANQPIITVFDEGHTVEIKISAVDDSHVQLDARLSFLKIDSVETDTIGESTTQAPVHNSLTQRVVRTVKLGETLRQKIPTFGKEKPMVFEYTVTELKACEKNRFKVDVGRTVAKVKP